MRIKSIVAGAAIALAAATGSASAGEEYWSQGSSPGESPLSVPNTGSGILNLNNQLFGQGGNNPVPIVADPNADPSAAGDYTFYGRYPSPGGGLDDREPLGTTWGERYLQGGPSGDVSTTTPDPAEGTAQPVEEKVGALGAEPQRPVRVFHDGDHPVRGEAILRGVRPNGLPVVAGHPTPQRAEPHESRAVVQDDEHVV